MAVSTWRVNNSTLLGGEVCSTWQAGHAYALGARCVPTLTYGTAAAKGYVFECTDDGTSHATTQPTWDYTVGNTTSDGTVTWTCRSPNDGDWDNATCILYYLWSGSRIADGDTVYVDDGHDEDLNWSTAQQYLGSETFSNPTKIICVDKADDSLSSGAVIENSAAGSNAQSLRYAFYIYGVCFKSRWALTVGQTSSSDITLEGDGTTIALENDEAGIDINIGAAGDFSNRVRIINASIKLAGSTAATLGILGQVDFLWSGGSFISSTGTTVFITPGGYSGMTARIEGVNLSAIGNDNSLVAVGGSNTFNILFDKCILPATFNLTSGTWNSQGIIKLHHCVSGPVSISERRTGGTIQDETTIKRTGGASDGTTPYCLKMVANTEVLDNFISLESPPITIWNPYTVEKTFTIECLWDSGTNIQDDEVWMELLYFKDAGDTLGQTTRDKCATLGTPSDQAAGVGTGNWTTTGLAAPNSFKLSVTVTPGKAGPVTARVHLAKVSATIYIDPLITIS